VSDTNPVPGERGERAGKPGGGGSAPDDSESAEAAKVSYCTHCGKGLTALTAKEEQEFEAVQPLLSKWMVANSMALTPIDEVADPDGTGAGKRSTGYDNYGQYDGTGERQPTGVTNRLPNNPPPHSLPAGPLSAAVEAVEQAARLVAKDALGFSMPAGTYIVGKARSAAKGMIEAVSGESTDEDVASAMKGLRRVVRTCDEALEAGSLGLDGCREVLQRLNAATEALQADAAVEQAEQAALPWNRGAVLAEAEAWARMRKGAGLPPAKFLTATVPLTRCKTYADPSAPKETLQEIARRRAGLRGAFEPKPVPGWEYQTPDGRTLDEQELRMRRVAGLPVKHVEVMNDGSTVGKGKSVCSPSPRSSGRRCRSCTTWSSATTG
jgi:hypothetical protein